MYVDKASLYLCRYMSLTTSIYFYCSTNIKKILFLLSYYQEILNLNLEIIKLFSGEKIIFYVKNISN